VLEAVAGAAADEPHVVALGMPVDQEVAVRGVLVLADLARDQRRILQRRETARHERARFRQAVRRHDALPGVRIERGAVPVGRDLHAFALGRRLVFIGR